MAHVLHRHPPSHRVDRVLGFFSSRPNWRIRTPPPSPSRPQASVSPPFGWGVGGGRYTTHSIAGEWVGGPIPTRGQTFWYSRYICTLPHHHSNSKKIFFRVNNFFMSNLSHFLILPNPSTVRCAVHRLVKKNIGFF
jgi:hypothetical protein